MPDFVHPDIYLAPDHEAPETVLAYAMDRSKGTVSHRHNHARGQLIHSVEGSLQVTVETGSWIVPPDRAVWVPPFIEHEVHSLTDSKLRMIYVRSDRCPDLPQGCCVMTVTRLLRELVMAMMQLPRQYDAAGPDGRLVDVLIDQIAASKVAPLHLPMPRNDRMHAIAMQIATDPSDSRRVGQWAEAAGMSQRTFERRYRAETGMTFLSWRQRARLLKSLEFLAEGLPVSQTAFQLGYESPSAFIAMFRRGFGTTPSRYFN